MTEPTKPEYIPCDNGKLPICFNYRKTIYDPNQLCNLNGHFFCRTCRDKILAQRKEAS